MSLVRSTALAAAFLAAAISSAAVSAEPSLRLVAADPRGGEALAAEAWQAVLAFYGDSEASQAKRGSAYDLVVAGGSGSYEGALRQASEAKPDLVVAAGSRFASALSSAAAQYPDQKYLLIGGGAAGPNVMAASLGGAEAAYLAGLAAGLEAKAAKVPSPKFGFLGGAAGPDATALELGFAAGLLAALPAAPILDFYAGGEDMPELGRVQAGSWYDSGVYCLFDAAGRTGEGSVAAARERRAAGKEAWIVGEAARESGLYDPASPGSAVLASIRVLPGPAIIFALGAIKDGTFKGGAAAYGLEAGGAAFGFNAGAAAKDIASRLDAARKDLAAGKVRLYASYAAALAAKALPEGLQAQD